MLKQTMRFSDRANQGFGERRGGDALSCPDKQLVAEDVAQARQAVGDRGLSDVERLGGPGDARLAVDGLEDVEEIEVELRQVAQDHHILPDLRPRQRPHHSAPMSITSRRAGISLVRRD
jgi:hypothetical protein